MTLAAGQHARLTHIYIQNTSVCVCVLERGQRVGGRLEASLGKHKLQTVEITGVQTGRDLEQDPAFLCNPPPQACCLYCSIRGPERQRWKTEEDEGIKRELTIFLV